MKYDFVVVGAGMFGATFARAATDRGKKVLVVDRQRYVGGTCRTETRDGVIVHVYGPHVFRTNNEQVWRFVNRFAKFRPHLTRVKTVYQGRVYPLPFCMGLFHALWGVVTPAEARRKLDEVSVPVREVKSVEDWALSSLGREIYEKFVYGYTLKQWGREPSRLPAAILQRLPIRLVYDDEYSLARWKGIPEDGYSGMFERMLDGIEVSLGHDYFEDRAALDRMGRVVFSGRVDQFFGFRFGALEFRTCRFEGKTVDGDFQGGAVFHYPEPQYPFTRVTEHKHFSAPDAPRSPVTWEYPYESGPGDEPHYPINDEKNTALYEKYLTLSTDAVFGGRIGSYRYFDMSMTIAQAMKLVEGLAV